MQIAYSLSQKRLFLDEKELSGLGIPARRSASRAIYLDYSYSHQYVITT